MDELSLDELFRVDRQPLGSQPPPRSVPTPFGDVPVPRSAFSPPANPQPPVGARPPKIRYTHDAMIDMILAHPEWSQGLLADQFGYSESWVSTIMTSDAFLSRLAERRKEIVDPALMASVEHNFKAVVHRSLEVIKEKLSRPADAIPDQLALQALQISSRAAGFGAREQVVPQSPVSVHVHLESMADNLTKLLQRKRAEAVTFSEPEESLTPGAS